MVVSYVDSSATDVIMQAKVQRIDSGDKFLAYLIARGNVAANQFYSLGISSGNGTDNQVHLWLGKYNGATYTNLGGSAGSIFPWESGDYSWHDCYIKFAVFGNTLKGKVWKVGESEPADWQVTATDSDFASGIGGVMLATYHTLGWDTAQAAFDDVSLTSLSEAEVWVDDSWVGKSPGEEVSPGKIFGYNAFATIQAGINAVDAGGTINVAAGTYTEALTITNKALTITGASETGVIVQTRADWTTEPTSNVFTINASGKTVTIQTMTIRNGDYGIRSTAGNVNVLYCTIYHNGWDGTGVPDTPTKEAMASFYTTYATDGGAIRIEKSASSEVAYCTVYENDRGIRYQEGDDGDFHHNKSYNNIQSGIYLTDHGSPAGCTNSQVHDNEVYGNMNAGILILRGNNISIANNKVYNNWNTGIHMHGPSDFEVRGNEVRNNSLYSFNGEGVIGTSSGGIAAAGAESVSATTETLRIENNIVSNNKAGSLTSNTGIWLGTGLPDDGIFIVGNSLSQHNIDIDIESQAGTTVIHNNNFDGQNTGVRNSDASNYVDATNNWWGAASGPYHPTTNPDGTGDTVSNNVTYDPWLVQEYPPAVVKGEGDVDGDGRTELDDVRTVLQFALKLTTPTDAQKAAADVNGDGVVNMADVECIARRLIGLTCP